MIAVRSPYIHMDGLKLNSVSLIVAWHRKQAEVIYELMAIHNKPSAIPRRCLAGVAREGA